MKHAIDTTTDGLCITATTASAKQQALLDELAKCAAGTCSCPTAQYEKVESIDVSAEATCVRVNLKVKPGEAIDTADIERCLEHTAKQIGA